MEKIEQVFRYNNLSSGSFRSYCEIQNSRASKQKMFIVILPRESVSSERREKYHPVIVSEIKSVRPRLCESTFEETPSISIASKTIMNLSTKAKWFDLPEMANVDINASTKKAYVQFFGQGSYENQSIANQLEALTVAW